MKIEIVFEEKIDLYNHDDWIKKQEVMLETAKITPDNKKTITTFLWAFNPVLIYGTYLIGQFDIIVGTLILLSIFFAKKNMKYISVIFIGLGIGFKTVPIVFVLPLILILGSSWKEYLKLLFVLALTICIPISLFLIHSNAVLYAIFPGVLQGKMVGSHGPEIAKLIKLALLGLGYLSLIVIFIIG